MACEQPSIPRFHLRWTGTLPQVHPVHAPDLPAVERWLAQHLSLELWSGGLAHAFRRATLPARFASAIARAVNRLGGPTRLTADDFAARPLADLNRMQQAELAIRLASANSELFDRLVIPPWTRIEAARVAAPHGPRPGWMVLQLGSTGCAAPQALIQLVGVADGPVSPAAKPGNSTPMGAHSCQACARRRRARRQASPVPAIARLDFHQRRRQSCAVAHGQELA